MARVPIAGIFSVPITDAAGIRARDENPSKFLADSIVELVAAGKHSLAEALRIAVYERVQNDSAKCLGYLVDQGIRFESIDANQAWSFCGKSKSAIEILIDNGFDINGVTKTSRPYQYLLYCVSDADMIAWLMNHGARIPNVRPGDYVLGEPREDTTQYALMDRVAVSGSVASFILLQKAGAPIDSGKILHIAVSAARSSAPDPRADRNGFIGKRKVFDKTEWAQRLAMVTHLIDVVGLDINAPDYPLFDPTKGLGPPICWAATSGDGDARELVYMLLERGADPTPALEGKTGCRGSREFVQQVQDWNAQERDRSKCCLQ